MIGAIVWCQCDFAFANYIPNWANPLRGDEICFATLDSRDTQNYAIGHPRALIKWASCTYAIENETVCPYRVIADEPDANVNTKLIWLGHRIGLKVYKWT